MKASVLLPVVAEFQIGDKVHFLGRAFGYCSDEIERDITSDEMAHVESVVISVRFLPGSQGWQYGLQFEVPGAGKDAEGTAILMDFVVDDTDRLDDGTLPLTLLIRWQSPSKPPAGKTVQHIVAAEIGTVRRWLYDNGLESTDSGWSGYNLLGQPVRGMIRSQRGRWNGAYWAA